MSAFVLSEKAYSSICSAILTYKDEIRWEKATTIDGGHRLAYIERKEA